MRPNQRNYLDPIIWVLIFGLANVGGQPENAENFEILTEIDLNGEIKLNRTDVELDEMVSNSTASEEVIVDDWYIIYPDDWYPDNYEFTLQDYANDTVQDYANDTDVIQVAVEKTNEEFEVSTIVMFALGVTILFIAGTKFIIGAGYCSSRSPSIPEIRSSMGLSLSEPGPEGVVHENQPLVDDVFPDDPIQNQNNAGAIQQV